MRSIKSYFSQVIPLEREENDDSIKSDQIIKRQLAREEQLKNNNPSKVFSLSKYILLPIYNEWLDAIDFCHVDTAVCNHLERRQFLQLIGNECVKFPGLEQDTVCIKYLKWVAVRKMCITHLFIEKQLLVRIFTKCLPFFVNLKHLVVNNYDTKFSEKLQQLLCTCTQLESFRLSTSKAFECVIIETLSKKCSSLQSIELVYNKSNPGCTSVSDDVMIDLVNSCPGLTAVKLSNFVNLTGNVLNALANNCCLKALSIKNMPLLTAEHLDVLVECCLDMTEISLKDCELITLDDFSRILARSSIWRKVCFLPCNFGFPTQFLSTNALMYATHLTTLKLSSVKIFDKDLELITITCSKLMVLEVMYQYSVTHDGFMHIANNCRHLTELSLASCISMTDDVVVAIVDSKLNRLNLNECHALTDISLQHIVRTCPNLTSLSIGGNMNYTLTIEFYENLMKVCPKLTFLNISVTFISFPIYTRVDGKVVVSRYGQTRDIPNELFTDAIKPDTSLKELWLKVMELSDETRAMISSTHRTLKVVNKMSMSYCMRGNPHDSD